MFDFWLPWIRLCAQMTAVWYEQTPQRFQQEWQKAFVTHYWRRRPQLCQVTSLPHSRTPQ